MRRSLYEAQDQVDEKKENLLTEVGEQLNQRAVLKPLFTIHWKVI